MQSQLLTYAADCQRVVLDAPLSPACAVSAANLRCWLSESCLRRSSLSCAVSAANLRCWLSESCLRRSSRPLLCSLDCQPALLVVRELSVLDALLSPVQSRLPTCAAGWQRVVLDAALSPVQSRLLTCAAGVVDAPVSI